MISKLKKNINKFIIIIALICIANFTDTFKKIYFIYNYNLNQRMFTLNNDFCEKDGDGYLFYIKDKFKNISNFNIKNLKNNKNYDWIFYKKNPKNNNYIAVLFNYKQNQSLNLKFKNYEIIDNYKNDCLFLKRYD